MRFLAGLALGLAAAAIIAAAADLWPGSGETRIEKSDRKVIVCE